LKNIVSASNHIKLNKTATETYGMLKLAFIEETMSRIQMFDSFLNSSKE
jgi:hypothetical protein